jgi:phosphate transport system substrate-binding protein
MILSLPPITHPLIRWLLLIWLAVPLVACAPAGPQSMIPTSLRVAGSTSMLPALRELAQAYQKEHPEVMIELRGGGSATGLDELRAGRADIAAISWLPEQGEALAGLRAEPVARDALAIVVNPQNDVPGLSLVQIRAIYRGEVLDWAALGGPALEPIVISREEGSGTRAAFEALVMAGDRVTLNAIVMPTTQAVVDYVATHAGAIGYVSFSAVDTRVRALAVEELLPSPGTIRSGAYHLTRLLYLCISATGASPASRSFLDFVLSPAGQAIIGRYHVPLR